MPQNAAQNNDEDKRYCSRKAANGQSVRKKFLSEPYSPATRKSPQRPGVWLYGLQCVQKAAWCLFARFILRGSYSSHVIVLSARKGSDMKQAPRRMGAARLTSPAAVRSPQNVRPISWAQRRFSAPGHAVVNQQISPGARSREKLLPACACTVVCCGTPLLFTTQYRPFWG